MHPIPCPPSRPAGPADAAPAPEPRIAAADWIRQHAADVHRYARALGADATLADDLTQDAFVAAFCKCKQHLEPRALATFLRRAVRLAWLQQLRGNRRREAAIAAAVERTWGSGAPTERDARVAATRACVEQLRGRAAEAVRRFYSPNRGAGRAAIARALGMTPNGVKTLLARTRRALGDCITRRLA